MKKIIPLFIILLAAHLGQAQQHSIFSNPIYAELSNNPSFIGMEPDAQLFGTFRQQWTGLTNPPEHNFLHFSFRLKKTVTDTIRKGGVPVSQNKLYADLYETKERISFTPHGIGLALQTDKNGPFEKNSLHLNYAYHRKLGSSFFVALGIGLGVGQMQIRSGGLWVLDDGDKTYEEYKNDLSSDVFLDGKMGITLYNSNFFLSYSTNQLMGNEPFSEVSEELDFLLQNQHTIGLSYILRPIDIFEIAPVLQITKVSAAPTHISLGVKARYKKRISLGLVHRVHAANSVQMGLQLAKKWILQYGYEWSGNETKTFASTTHEIGFGYRLKNTKEIKHQW